MEASKIPPETRYAKSDGVRIAYQVLGRGPVDLAYGRTAISQLELNWEEPSLSRFLRELSKFTRLLLWDKRGTGLSDRTVGISTLESDMDDLLAAMDAAGSRRAVLFGGSDSAAMDILFAATHPERTLGLVLLGPLARGLWSEDYPWVWTREEYESSARLSERDWGTEPHIDRLIARRAPSKMGDPAFKRWLGRVIRFGSSPTADTAFTARQMDIDVREQLEFVHVPTLVLQSPGDQYVRPENAKYVASRIPGARLVELPGSDHHAWANPEGAEAELAAIRRFVRDLPSELDFDRVLLTVLFVDIVGSTRRASHLGDRAWAQLLDRYIDRVRVELVRFRGREVKTMGDGLLAVFDGPTRAVRAAIAFRERAVDLGLDVRCGLHTGECHLSEGDVQGLAVHLAARVGEKARPGEVLVSATVRDLSVGSGVRFRDRGVHSLKGVEGGWRMYSVRDSALGPTDRRQDRKGQRSGGSAKGPAAR